MLYRFYLSDQTTQVKSGATLREARKKIDVSEGDIEYSQSLDNSNTPRSYEWCEVSGKWVFIRQYIQLYWLDGALQTVRALSLEKALNKLGAGNLRNELVHSHRVLSLTSEAIYKHNGEVWVSIV